MESFDSSQRKQALVIGINKYPRDHSLAYCIHDAEDLSVTLRGIGFDVLVGLDCTGEEFKQMIDAFSKGLRRNDLVLFYFAGHGKQMEGWSYLLPSDYDYIHDTTEAEFIAKNAIHANYITTKLSDSCGTTVFVFDCSRNNVRTRGMDLQQGLTYMNTPPETLCVFSCAPGKGAIHETRNGRNGIFLGCLLEHIEASDQHIETVLMNVTRDVIEQTHGYQVPYRTSCLTKELYLRANSGMDTFLMLSAPTVVLIQLFTSHSHYRSLRRCSLSSLTMRTIAETKCTKQCRCVSYFSNGSHSSN